MFSKIAQFAVIAVSAVTLSAVHAPAVAASGDDTSRVTVRYDDLNLHSAAGAQALMHRIQAAAKSVCGPEPTDRLSFGRQYAACVVETTNRALVDLGQANLALVGADADRG